MWRVIGAVGAIFFGAAVTAWEMNQGPEPPYDTWSISHEVALDVAEATLRYQIENEVTRHRAKRAQWFVLVYGDIASDEFAGEFQEYPQIITSYDEVDTEGDRVLFQIASAKRVDDQRIVVLGQVIGGKDTREIPSLALAGDKKQTIYRVEKRDGTWVVAAATNP